MKKLSLFVVMGFLPFLCFSQKTSSSKNAPREDPFVTFEYMHVKPGNENAYLQVENFWRKIHEDRFKNGEILGWSVWEVVAPYSIEASYQYVVVTVYPHFTDILHSLEGLSGGMDVHRIFPGVSEDSLRKMGTLTRTSRDIVRRDIFSPDGHVGDVNGDSIKYLMATYVKVAPDKEMDFHSFMRESWTPMVEKVVKGGFAKLWWYGSKQFGGGADAPYNHIMVVNWSRENFFDDTPPFAQYQKEDPAAFEGYKWRTIDHRELLHKVVSLDNKAK